MRREQPKVPARAMFLAALLAGTACAHNLGVRGKVWPIAEPNLMKVMMLRASHVNWKAKDKLLADKAKYALSHLAFAPLVPAQATKVLYYRPQVVLKRNITAPVWIDGKYVWRVVARKGTVVNPLERGIRPPTRMLFFDPRHRTQLKFALLAQRAYPTLIQLVATGGDVRGLARKIRFPVFYAYPFIVKGFHVRRTPTLVGIGTGQYADAVSLVQFGPTVLAHSTSRNSVKSVRALLDAAWYGGVSSRIRKVALDEQ